MANTNSNKTAQLGSALKDFALVQATLEKMTGVTVDLDADLAKGKIALHATFLAEAPAPADNHALLGVPRDEPAKPKTKERETARAAGVKPARPEHPRSLYAPGRASYGHVLSVENLREQVRSADRRLTKEYAKRQSNTVTFSGWAYKALGEHVDVEDLKATQEHRVRQLNAQAESDESSVRFRFRDTASGFRIDALRVF